jgi:hypothetical protein
MIIRQGLELADGSRVVAAIYYGTVQIGNLPPVYVARVRPPALSLVLDRSRHLVSRQD